MQRLFWNKKEGGRLVHFGDVPFTVQEDRILDCQYGNHDFKSKEPQGKRLCLQGSRKIGCHAHVQYKTYTLYPGIRNQRKGCCGTDQMGPYYTDTETWPWSMNIFWSWNTNVCGGVHWSYRPLLHYFSCQSTQWPNCEATYKWVIYNPQDDTTPLEPPPPRSLSSLDHLELINVHSCHNTVDHHPRVLWTRTAILASSLGFTHIIHAINLYWL